MRLGLIFFFIFSICPQTMARLPSPLDVANLISKKYKGLESFSMKVSFEDIGGGSYIAKYWQRGENWKLLWEKKDKDNIIPLIIEDSNLDNNKKLSLKKYPILPLSLQDFSDPYNDWVRWGIDVNCVSYEYVDHVPCIAIGNSLNRIFIDIENYVIRKKIINGRTYLFKDFLDVGNYLLPTIIQVKCNNGIFNGHITWEDINTLKPSVFLSPIVPIQTKGLSVFESERPCVLNCLPMATTNSLYK